MLFLFRRGPWESRGPTGQYFLWEKPLYDRQIARSNTYPQNLTNITPSRLLKKSFK